MRYDLIGATAIPRQDTGQREVVPEVRMRFAARCTAQTIARGVTDEIESLYLCGPAGGGDVSRSECEIIAIASTLIPSKSVKTGFEILESSDVVA